jgi:ElaB/YqjD/DUF883 family membrane-anchored ribosome-binding protein
MNGSGSEVFNTPQNGAAGAAGIADKVSAVGRDLQSKAADLAGASGEALKGHASELVETAKDVASKAGDRLQETMAQQKGAGADYVSNLAQTMRRAAGEFDAEVPLAATYIRKAADQVTNAADAFREGNLNDLVQRAQSFARNQPTAFVGLAVLAGFGAIRFLKSASNPSSTSSGDETFKSSVGLGN